MTRLCALLLVLLSVCGLMPSQVFAAAGADQVLFDQALQASRQGDVVQALPLWDRYLALHPGDPAALSNRGNVRLVLGDPDGAIADQTRSIELSPDEIDPHLNRGTAEEALEQWDAAAADYDWILERDPAEASALYNLGNVRGAQHNWAAAAQLYSQAALARPGFAMARSSEAMARYQLAQLEQAERELRNLIRRYPMFADARAGLSALLWKQGQRGEAESHWAAASGLDPRYRQADWLVSVRRWPPGPTADLMAFLDLKSS
ncbi:MAG: tetratricopeptide repeat protein [Synechococcus sp.]